MPGNDYVVCINYYDMKDFDSSKKMPAQQRSSFSFGALHRAFSFLQQQSEDRCFDKEVVVARKLDRYIASAGIVQYRGGEPYVLLTKRSLNGFEDIGMPSGVYLVLNEALLTKHDFQLKTGYELGADGWRGPDGCYGLVTDRKTLELPQVLLQKRNAVQQDKKTRTSFNWKKLFNKGPSHPRH